MAGTVVIGCADQSLAYELRSQLAEATDLEVLGLADTTAELVRVVVERDPDLVIVHDRIGPDPVHHVIRDLQLRRPASVNLVVTGDPDTATLAEAMDAGARGVLVYPFSFTEVQQRVTNALEWSLRLRELLEDRGESVGGHRALVLAVAGAKGGVGVSSIATHIAWDVRREIPAHKVLVIDLDLEKGDVSSIIEARHRTSVADLAKVADDLSPRTVADAVFVHETGLHLLLPPDDVRDSEFVTAAAIRQIVALVRQQYDLVVVDVGARVTPVQAAVVEIADEVLVVTTPDLVAVRGLRRTCGWWETLAVRKPDAVHVVVNRHTRSDEVQPDTLARLSPSPLTPVHLPDLGRKFEQATNSRSPEYMTEAAWWQALRALGRHLGVGAREAAEAPEGRATRRRGRRAAGDDTGAVSLEFVGVLPWVLLIGAAMVQLAVTVLTVMWTGYAASAAARAVSLHEPHSHVVEAARDRMPVGMRHTVKVSEGPLSGRVEVTTNVPVLAPGLMSSPWEITIDRRVVVEP